MTATTISIEAFELQGRPTGPGRYLHNLLHAWAELDADVEFVLLHDEELTWSIPDSPRISLYQIPQGIIGAGWYRQQRLVSRALNHLKPDLHFSPAYSLPLLWRGPNVVSVHDISFEVHPEWFSFAHGLRMRWLTRWSCRRAEAVLTATRFACADILRAYNLEEGKVTVIPHGVASVANTPARPSVPPYILMLGSVFERRYPLEILDAFELLGDIEARLVIAGADRRSAAGDLQAEIEARSLSDRVTWEGYVSPQRRQQLLEGAWALLYLSRYEGFGLPPLEAMAAGVPAIVSRRGALEELYGETAWLVESETPEEIARLVRRVLGDELDRRRKAQAGLELAHSMDIHTMAENTLEVLLRHAR